MKPFEIQKRIHAALTGYTIRKAVFLGISLAALICGALASMYFQFAYNSGMQTLMTVAALAVCIGLTVATVIMQGNELYTRCMLVAYATRVDTTQIHGGAAIRTQALQATQPFIANKAAYKQAKSECKELLNGMLTDCAAFSQYANKGIITKLCSLLMRYSCRSFADFAIIDAVTNGNNNIRSYSILSSTRWYKTYKGYTPSILKSVAGVVAPLILGIIIANIASSTLDNMFDITGATSTLITGCVLCIAIQLVLWGGNQANLNKMGVTVISPETPQPDFEVCTAFAGISTAYYNRCVEAGYMQPVSATAVIDA